MRTVFGSARLSCAIIAQLREAEVQNSKALADFAIKDIEARLVGDPPLKRPKAFDTSALAASIEALERLADHPRHHGFITLESEADLYRVRIGNYRAVFTIEDDRLVVLVLKIGHRREVYR